MLSDHTRLLLCKSAEGTKKVVQGKNVVDYGLKPRPLMVHAAPTKFIGRATNFLGAKPSAQVDPSNIDINLAPYMTVTGYDHPGQFDLYLTSQDSGMSYGEHKGLVDVWFKYDPAPLQSTTLTPVQKEAFTKGFKAGAGIEVKSEEAAKKALPTQ